MRSALFSAFYSATWACALIIVWLGSYGGALPAQHLTESWAPEQDLTSEETWHAPLLAKYTVRVSKLLLTNYDNCFELIPHINFYLSTRRPRTGLPVT